MGCASSKRVEATTVDHVYRPPPTSFAVFDINTIQEPWLITNKPEDDKDSIDEDEDDGDDDKQKQITQYVPEQLLHKLNSIDDAPRTWDEVSKDLQDLKPTLNSPKPKPKSKSKSPPPIVGPTKRVPRKSFSFHTLEELETRALPVPMKRTESMNELNKLDSAGKNSDFKKFQLKKTDYSSQALVVRGSDQSKEYKPLKENIFIVKDRLEKEKEGKEALFVKRDPLSDYQELCPPGGYDSVVLYTTSLGGVRRTFEDCNRIRTILELHRVVFDERDISLHGKFLRELKDLLGDEVASVPRMFVKGKYIGGVDEIVHLNEMGRLGRLMSWARVERGVGRFGCVGCGGARFVPCFECDGSRKVVVAGKKEKEKCEKCNENGLVHCPTCA